MKPIKPETISITILCARVLISAIIIAFALGYPISMQTLQLAELVTVCINTIKLLLIVCLLVAIAGHSILGTDMPRPRTPRTPAQKVIIGLIFALELASFALVGWWFTLGLRITAFVIVKTTLHEEVA